MARVEMYHERVGKGYLVGVWDNNGEWNGFKCYDVELAYGGRYIVTLNKGCVGEKSAKYWFDVAVNNMRKIMFLLDGQDRANHNMLCYSTNYLMDEPRDGYFEEWNEAKATSEMLDEWIDEQMKFWSNEEIQSKLREEFR